MGKTSEVIEVRFQNAAGALISTLVAVAKTFSTGSRGYNATGKVEIGGKRYQVSVNLVEIGSKPKA